MSRFVRKPWTIWRIIGTALSVVVVLLVGLVGWQYWLFAGGIFRTSSFNSAKWKSLVSEKKQSSCYRGGMAHDIKTNVLRAGQDKKDVERLLGLPDAARTEVYEYTLGMCSGFQIDFDALVVHFDSQGMVSKVQTVQH